MLNLMEYQLDKEELELSFKQLCYELNKLFSELIIQRFTSKIFNIKRSL